MIRNAKLTFKPSMVWEKEVWEFVKKKQIGGVLNVPCGESKLGDMRVDLDPKVKPDKIADMFKLPFKNNTFDTVLSDPPWKLNYYDRPKQFFELIRVCKVDGQIIFNATWLPESKAVELKEIWVRQSARFGNISILAIFKKLTDKFGEAEK